MDMNDLFGDLDQKDFGSSPEVAAKKEAVAPKFPCMSCAGTGIFKGVRVHQPETKCFACGGKGFHKKDHWEAMKDKRATKIKREATIAKNKRDRSEAFFAANPGLYAILREHESWNKFCFNVMSDIHNDRYPNAKAIEIIRDIDAKSKARDAERQAKKDALSIALDYSAIHKMFDTAKAKGLKKVSYRAEGFKMSPAASSGRNPGAIYVKRENGAYLGKVIEGKFHAGHGVTEIDTEKMQSIARDPLQAAKAYGKLTGRCACCGRELTDHVSIELGIGPICAEKWGFMGSDAMPSDQAKVIRKEGRAKQNKIIRDAAIEAGAQVTEKTGDKNSPPSVAGQYDHLYLPGMTAAEKKAVRAKARKARA